MYDQSQFTPLYFMGPNSIWLNENSYALMHEISGYAPSVWYTYTQNKPGSFWLGAYDQESLEKESENGFIYFSKPGTVEYFEESIQKYVLEAKKLSQRFFVLQQDPATVVDFLQEIHHLVSEIMGHYLATQPQRFYAFEEKIKGHLDDPDLAFVASNGHRLTLFSQIQKALLEKDTLTIENLGFLNWGLLGGERITPATIVDNEEKERETRHTLEASVEKRKILLAENNLEIYKLADVMGRAGVLRFDLQMIVLCLLKYADVLFESVRVQKNIDTDNFKSYLYDELIALITNDERVDETVLALRQRGCLVRYAQEGVQTYYADEAHNVIQELLKFRQKEIESTKELQGSVASYPDKNTSVIQGECFVMTTAFDADTIISDFKEGQILVATQTHPNVVPIMRLAKAIITDEGGITCHAAIASRELRKPCIIGTRLGTKILRTGDRVEMNLQTGAIKKL